MPQPNTKTKYRPLPAALLTLVVLLASTLLIWLAVVRPQLGKGRTETLCDNFDRSELLADGDTAAQVFTYDKALYTIGLEFYLPGAQPQGELEVVLSDADTGEELARSTGVMQNIIPDQYTTLGLDPVVPAQEGRHCRLSVTAHYTSDAVLAIGAVAALIDSFLDIRGRIRGIDASPASHPTVLLQMIGLDERGHRPG